MQASKRLHSESGFSLAELMVATGLLLVVSAIVTNALLQMSNQQKTIANRTEMHSSIRGATELLQQEVGQAGRISLPATATLTQAISAPGGAAPAAAATCDPATPTVGAVTVNVSSTSGMWATSGANPSYILLTMLDGDSQESVRVASISGSTITACFQNAHANGTVVAPMGGFATGILPPSGLANGSGDFILKLYGDINSDGNMVYVEYTCDVNAGKLYRNVMSWTAATKPPVSDSMALLTNITQNPSNAPCFSYQTATQNIQGTTFTFVLDVAITLTVQTNQLDPITHVKQQETKALLNVSPRNVFNAWALASIGYTDHIQSTPTSITALLP